MVKKFALGFACTALGIALAANGYDVTFYHTVNVSGTTLKAGHYKLELKDNIAVIKQGGVTAEAPVKVETSDRKFSENVVRVNGDQIEEIRLGHTRTRLVFEKTRTATN